MPSSVTRLVKRSVRAGQKMVSQIVVSVAAAVCVGLITNAYLEGKPASSVPAATQASQDITGSEAPVAAASAEPSKLVVGDEAVQQIARHRVR